MGLLGDIFSAVGNHLLQKAQEAYYTAEAMQGMSNKDLTNTAFMSGGNKMSKAVAMSMLQNRAQSGQLNKNDVLNGFRQGINNGTIDREAWKKAIDNYNKK